MRKQGVVDRVLNIGVLLLAVSSGLGQKLPAISEKKNAETVRLVDVPFKEDPALSGLSASPVLSYPIQCSGDGTPFVEMFAPPDFNKEEVYSIDSSGSHVFNMNLIDDLSNKVLHDYYAGTSEVVFLLSATEGTGQNPVQSLSAGSTSNQEHRVEHDSKYYVAKFDMKGTYKGHTRLDASFTPRKIAEFDSGIFVSYGVDNESRKLSLALIDSGGSVLRYLELPSDYGAWYKSYSGSALKSRSQLKPTILPVSQMLPYLDRILVVQRNSRLPVIAVREDGNIQQFEIGDQDRSSVIDSVIPSDNSWFVRFRNETQAGTRVSSESPTVFEVDPQTGTLLAQLNLQGIRTDELACFRGGALIGLRRDDQGKFIALLGQIK